MLSSKARVFVLVDLREFFFRFRVKGGGRTNKIFSKSSGNDQLTGRRFFFSFSEGFLFLISPEKTVKLVR